MSPLRHKPCNMINQGITLDKSHTLVCVDHGNWRAEIGYIEFEEFLLRRWKGSSSGCCKGWSFVSPYLWKERIYI